MHNAISLDGHRHIPLLIIHIYTYSPSAIQSLVMHSIISIIHKSLSLIVEQIMFHTFFIEKCHIIYSFFYQSDSIIKYIIPIKTPISS